MIYSSRHQHAHDKLCRQAIKFAARELAVSYSDGLTSFRFCELPVTRLFWRFIEARHPGAFVGVSYCMGCRKFNLEAS